MTDYLSSLMSDVKAKDPAQPEFHQAVHEVAESIDLVLERHPEYRSEKILERIIEPERVVLFRVPWVDDAGDPQINRGFRVEMNSAIGPYKGGLRFHPSVNLGILKFLAFEQVFKNALTTLPMGGGKGGSDFDPKGKSDNEVMRFCQSFMTELFRHIGPDVDVPAGDIGVGGREIGYMFGQYMRLTNEFEGVLTGKGLSYGGSAVRKEATGYGAVYFLRNMLERADESLEGKRIAISGAGNVALYAAEKAIQEGAKVVTLSDSHGHIRCEAGLEAEALEEIKELKFRARGRLAELDGRISGVSYTEGEAPWGMPCDVAMPCATQNEIGAEAAATLVDHGLMAVVEGANMPCTEKAIECFREHRVLFAPGKAANAGGVAVSGLEQTQNVARVSWPRNEVDRRLKEIMRDIHDKCTHEMEDDGGIDYIDAANRAGFRKVAEAMLAYGVV
ncbi:MAG: NADP-specific glutamate dehydrogenase [Candidatus Longimicrobiales bacterium M2_2A_002]